MIKLFSLFKTTKKLEISNDSGFLAIVNSDTYQSFVGEDWQFSQLMKHFIDEMNNLNIIFFATGSQSNGIIALVEKSSNKKAFREFTSTIKVTDRKLYLTNYEDLTMSAQFEDIKIPAKHNADLIIKLENGLYDLTVRQLFDPEEDDTRLVGKINFEIVIQRTEKETDKINQIYWWSE